MIANRDLHDDDEPHDLGLAHDLDLLPPPGLSRRGAIGLLAGVAGVTVLLPATSAFASSTRTPSETAGPYPGDGSNGPDVLDDRGIVRRNLRASFGNASGRAKGVPLKIALKVVHAKTGRAYRGAAVYAWHCDWLGRYSLYSAGVKKQNYLRGVQAANSAGSLSFLSYFPACYSGRWPHIHLEVYPSLAHAKTATRRLLTTQIALPKAACTAVYAQRLYTRSAHNLARTSLSSDMVFRDGWARELARVTGSVHAGYTASLKIAV